MPPAGRGQGLDGGTPDLAAMDPYLAALIGGDPHGAREALERELADGAPVARVCMSVIAPALHEVGRLWQVGRVTVAQEHVATAITRAQLAWLLPLLPAKPPTTRRLMLSVTPGEGHFVGVHLLGAMARADGWQVTVEESPASWDAIIRLAAARRPDVVGLSTALPGHLRAVRDVSDTLRLLFPRPFVLLGGGAYAGDERLARKVGADLFAPDAATAVAQLRSLLPAPSNGDDAAAGTRAGAQPGA